MAKCNCCDGTCSYDDIQKEETKKEQFDNIEACEDHFYQSLTGARGRQRGYAPLSDFDAEAARASISAKEKSIEDILERRLPLPARSPRNCQAFGKVVVVVDENGECQSRRTKGIRENNDIENIEEDHSGESTGLADGIDQTDNYSFEQELAIVREEAENLLNDLGRTIAYCGYVIPDMFKVVIEKAVPTEEVFTTNSASSEFLVKIYIGDGRMMLTGNRFQVVRDLSLVVKGAALLLAANLQEEE